MKLSDLKIDKRNANKGTVRGREALDKSLSELGAGRSVLIDKHGNIIAGNKTIEQAGRLGMKDIEIVQSDGSKIIAVQRTDLDLETDAKARKLAVADNRIGQLDLDWDVEQLLRDHEDIDLSDFWNQAELDELLKMADVPAIDDEQDEQNAADLMDKADEIEVRVKPGDLWRLGEHRLLCGDSTKREDVERVMDGEKADLVFTSPPYDNQRTYEIGEIKWDELMNNVFKQVILNIQPDSNIFVNLGLIHEDRKCKRYWEQWLDYMENIGWPLFGWYVWDQGAGKPGETHGRLASSFEWIFHFNIKKAQANKWVRCGDSAEKRKKCSSKSSFRQKDGSLREISSPDKAGQPYKVPDSVIRVNREMARGIHTHNHPACYPVELPEFGLRTWTDEADIVYDPFLGSGTTLIACEKLGRRGRGIEISPKYCQVVINRWELYAGKKAELI